MIQDSTSMLTAKGLSGSMGSNLFAMGNDRPAALSRDPSPTALRCASETEPRSVITHGKFKEEGIASPRSCKPLFLLQTALETCMHDNIFLVIIKLCVLRVISIRLPVFMAG
jgi:hypothetical protein